MKACINPLLLIALFLLASCFDKNHERKEIIKTWNAYRSAFANNLGTECSKYIDSASVRYYDHLLTLVRSADSTTVDMLKMDQKLAVLLARHTLSESKIMHISGKELFEELVKQSDGGKLSETLNFEYITLAPKHAEVRIIDTNGKKGLVVAFNKEFGVWKIDLVSISGQLSKSDWRELINESGRTEHDFVSALLELSNNVKPTNAVWHAVTR